MTAAVDLVTATLAMAFDAAESEDLSVGADGESDDERFGDDRTRPDDGRPYREDDGPKSDDATSSGGVEG